jgi:hypothetical protein
LVQWAELFEFSCVCDSSERAGNRLIQTSERKISQENDWMIGGGSGQGFEHGPALGEYAAKLILDRFVVHDFQHLNGLLAQTGGKTVALEFEDGTVIYLPLP